MLSNKKITIIGGGNMGGAIAKGILSAGNIAAKNITVADRSQDALKALSALGFNTTSDNSAAVSEADIVVFAVKPYLVLGVIDEVKKSVRNEALMISIAAGVTLEQLGNAFGGNRAVVRVIPNTAVEVGEAFVALSVKNTTDDEEKLAVELFSQLGLALVVDESLMSAITALASCGIAHALRFIRAAMEAGIEMGLTSKQSAQIAAQTVKGAAELVLKNNSHPEAEIDKVCTPKGVTIRGINEMEYAGFTAAVIKGIMGSYNKMVSK